MFHGVFVVMQSGDNSLDMACTSSNIHLGPTVVMQLILYTLYMLLNIIVFMFYINSHGHKLQE